MAYVNIGELKYLIEIRTPTRSVDANGHYVTTNVTITAHAGIRSASGRDVSDDGAARSEDTIQFIVRWPVRKAVTRDSVIVWNGIEHDIRWMDATPWAERYARIKAVAREAE